MIPPSGDVAGVLVTHCLMDIVEGVAGLGDVLEEAPFRFVGMLDLVAESLMDEDVGVLVDRGRLPA